MSTILPKDYPLYETVYGSEIPTEQYFVILFDKMPSKYVNNLFYDPKVINEVLLNDGFEQEIEILNLKGNNLPPFFARFREQL